MQTTCLTKASFSGVLHSRSGEVFCFSDRVFLNPEWFQRVEPLIATLIPPLAFLCCNNTTNEINFTMISYADPSRRPLPPLPTIIYFENGCSGLFFRPEAMGEGVEHDFLHCWRPPINHYPLLRPRSVSGEHAAGKRMGMCVFDWKPLFMDGFQPSVFRKRQKYPTLCHIMSNDEQFILLFIYLPTTTYEHSDTKHNTTSVAHHEPLRTWSNSHVYCSCNTIA